MRSRDEGVFNPIGLIDSIGLVDPEMVEARKQLLLLLGEGGGGGGGRGGRHKWSVLAEVNRHDGWVHLGPV